jgi:hypothetical protein
MKKIFSTILMSIIILFSSIVIVPLGMENASAESMVHTTTVDFESGDTSFVEISNGTLMLERGLHLNFYDGGSFGTIFYGNSVSGAGDVNGDGFADIIVGAYRDAEVGLQGGAAFYYNGSNDGVVLKDRIKLLGEAGNNEFGYSVAGAGDTNSDGYDDIIIGAWLNDDSAGDAGKIYLYNGSNMGPITPGAKNATGNTANELFGNAVAGAGDVNGDGYDDVIVGAYNNDDSFTDAGKVFVYNGSFDGISTSDPISITGEAASDEFGYSVAGAGDVNGDGYDDVIIGARYNDDTASGAGKAYVYLGSSSGLSESPSWTSTGEAGDDNFGYSVSCAGDINGDGFDDVIVGALLNDDNGGDAGKVYVYLGSWNGLDTTPAWNATGENAGDNFGTSVAGAGDVNGDGYDDVIIGSTKNDDAGTDAGKVYLYLGSHNGLYSFEHWTDIGEASLDSFGISVSGVGDVNGNGLDDIIIGASGNDYIISNSGKAYVYQYLTTTTVEKKTKWSAVGDLLSSSRLGDSVAGAGDINGDGFDDIVAGAPKNNDGGTWAGKVYVYNGSENYQNNDPPITVIGTNASDELGHAVDGAGDVNGNGYDDVIIAVPFNDTAGPNSGLVFIYNGSADGMVTIDPLVFYGENPDDLFGISIAGAGDTNGDGYDDIIVGAQGNDDSYNNAGKVYIYNGSENGLSKTPQMIYGEKVSERFGSTVDSAGDVNGDGYNDVIVGTFADGAYVYNGSSTGLSVSDRWHVGNFNSNSWFGSKVGGAGDVNGDGFDDILIGDRFNDTGGINGGRAYLYLGSSSGLSMKADWSLTGEEPGDEFGFSIAGAGDVNNDGYDDIIIGAYRNDDRGTDSGKAYLYLGSATGPSTNPAWTDSGKPGDRFGDVVASAGDFNGDGINELLIGSPQNDDAWSNAGKISLYTQPDYFDTGIYESPVFSSSGVDNLKWLSLEWEPLNQPESASVRFQVGTSADGISWTYGGPWGDSESFFQNPRGEQVSNGQQGTFWRYRTYLEASEKTKTPTVESVTINFGFSEISKPSVKVTSPNGGEDWMKGDFYPLTWEADGELNETPVQIYYSVDNGVNWNQIAVNVQNIGVYNWTVPNIETPNALIAVLVTDVYGNWVVDTSDAGFAIDPPPIQIGGGGTGFDPQSADNSRSTFDDLNIDTTGDTSKESSDNADNIDNAESGLNYALGIAIISIVLIVSVIVHIFLIVQRKPDNMTGATKDKAKIQRLSQNKPKRSTNNNRQHFYKK